VTEDRTQNTEHKKYGRLVTFLQKNVEVIYNYIISLIATIKQPEKIT
jgi:hypothetical protein